MSNTGLQASPKRCTWNLCALQAQFVIGTSRVATMHTRLAHKLASTMPIRLVTPAFEIPRLVELLQWHKYRDLDPGSLWLRERVFEAAANMPPLSHYADHTPLSAFQSAL
jgi:hypothetical protein